MAVATKKTLKRQLTISNMFNNRIRTTNFNKLSNQELVELSFNLEPLKAANY